MFRFLIKSTVLFLFCCHGFALDESRLWLPVSYQDKYLELKQAALTALEKNKCTEVLRGTLDRDRSSEHRSIYRILCRQENGRTYNELIFLKPEHMSAALIEELRRERETRVNLFWSVCEKEFKKRSELMIEVKRLSEGRVEPLEQEDGLHIFSFGFDAEDINRRDER